MADQIEKYCTAHKIAVTIYHQPIREKTVLLVCKHTFDPNVFACNLKCVYAQGAQMGVKVAMDMGVVVQLNSDGTIPLDVVKKAGFVDYTSKMPKHSSETIQKKWWQFWK